MKKLALLAITTAFFVAACGAPQKHSEAEAQQAINAAVAANKKADSVGANVPYATSDSWRLRCAGGPWLR